MKFILNLSTLLLLTLTVSAAEKTNAKAARKPANSAWIYCTAYSADEHLGRIEFGEDSRGTDAFVKVGGTPVEIVELDPKLVKFKMDGTNVDLKITVGKTRIKETWARGETRVYDMTAETVANGSKIKFFGACSSYNY